MKSFDSENQSVPDKECPNKCYKAEKFLFFLGFIFPIAWFVGSAYCCGDRQAMFLWRKRCTVASTLLLTGLVISVAVVMVINPDTFGLRSSPEESLSSSAIQPGVPIANSSEWGDTAAGISVYGT